MSSGLVIAGFGIAVLAGARGTWSPCGLSMVSAINPMAERSRGYRYWLTTVWFVAGSLAGSAVLGLGAVLLALGLGWLPVAVRIALGLVAALIVLASDRQVGRFRLPSHPRQVNELWLMQYRRWLYASGFGFQIGSGFATYIMTAANYLVLALAGLTGRIDRAFAICLCFGLVRGLAVLLSARCRSASALAGLHRRLAEWEPASLRAVMAGEALAAIVLGWAGFGGICAAVAAGLAAGVWRAGRPGPSAGCATGLAPGANRQRHRQETASETVSA